MAIVAYPGIAELDIGIAAGGRGPVAVDHVTIEIESDPIRADQDAVVGAVEEVAVEVSYRR